MHTYMYTNQKKIEKRKTQKRRDIKNTVGSSNLHLTEVPKM